VATFTTPFLGNVAGDFAAAIDWGDGSTTDVGAVSGGNGNFTVTGTHTYTVGGQDTVKVTVTDDSPGTASASGTGKATINFAGQMVLNSASEGTALPNGTPVATFSDSNSGDTPASFTATIRWGDGLTTPGAVSGGAGTFTVSGGHTYADEGNDPASVILTHTVDHASSTVSGSVAVAEADGLVPHGTSFEANAGQLFSGTVATFDDTGFPGNAAGDFTAAIDWGDGQITTGAVSGGNGSPFTVSGSHTYAAGGQETVKVKLSDDAPGTATATATTTAAVRSLSGQMALASALKARHCPTPPRSRRSATPIPPMSPAISRLRSTGVTALRQPGPSSALPDPLRSKAGMPMWTRAVSPPVRRLPILPTSCRRWRAAWFRSAKATS